jgi:hypothetical protein
MTLDDETIDALSAQSDWGAQAWAYAAHRRVENALREATRTPRKRPAQEPAALTGTQKRAISLWLRRGKPVSEIARKVGVSRGVVIAWRARGAS